MRQMEMQLMREVRFSLTRAQDDHPRKRNSWAGWPASDGIAPYLTLQGVVSGEVDADTGYVCNIKAVEKMLRSHATGHLRRAWAEGHGGGVAGEMPRLWHLVAPHTPQGTRLERLTLHTTPHLSYTVQRGESDMVSMTYAFEFSAAHRLYCDRLSPEENQRVFGRCTNPSGHGHNYVVQVTLKGAPDSQTGCVLALADFERIVNEEVIDCFDHKHLNKDCPEFATLNPSVENITRVIYDKLKGAFTSARLQRVRVYETPKTYAEYSEQQE